MSDSYVSPSNVISRTGAGVVGGLAGGGSNDWNNGEVYFIVPPAEWVWADVFCFELPTIARNGAAADCVEISFRLLNSAGEGVIYWQQAELLENLLDNPSLEATYAGVPPIPPGWTNCPSPLPKLPHWVRYVPSEVNF